MTALTKQVAALPPGSSRGTGPTLFKPVLPLPRFLTQSTTATEIGLATHLALQHLDFAATSTAEEISRQVSQMVAKKFLLAEQAPQVDVDAIAWLMQTELGILLGRNSRNLMRELPIYFPDDGKLNSSDPLDRVMVRGRLDVLIVDASGLTIADYKTDRVTEQTIDALPSSIFRSCAYRDAITGITGRPVLTAYLVFLDPRSSGGSDYGTSGVIALKPSSAAVSGEWPLENPAPR